MIKLRNINWFFIALIVLLVILFTCIVILFIFWFTHDSLTTMQMFKKFWGLSLVVFIISTALKIFSK